MTEDTPAKTLLRFNGNMFTHLLDLEQELHVVVQDANGFQVGEGFAKVAAITYSERDEKLTRMHTAKLS